MPLGIPHSIFLGRVPGPNEPYWLDDDQDKALAWTRREARRCPKCRTLPEEWERDPDAYLADTHRCLGCERVEQAYASVGDDERGVHAYLRPPTDEERAGLSYDEPTADASADG